MRGGLGAGGRRTKTLINLHEMELAAGSLEAAEFLILPLAPVRRW